MTNAITFRNGNRGAAQAIADRVASAVRAGQAVTVDGRPIATRHRTPAQVWNNGTVSFSVKARNGRPGSFDDVFVKRGAIATIEIQEA